MTVEAAVLGWPYIGEPRYTLCRRSERRSQYPHPTCALRSGRVGARCLYEVSRGPAVRRWTRPGIRSWGSVSESRRATPECPRAPPRRVSSRAERNCRQGGSRPRRYLLRAGRVGQLAVTCTGGFGLAVSNGGLKWRFQKPVLYKVENTRLRAQPASSKTVLPREPEFDASQSSLEPRQRVVGASEASVPARSRPPSVHEVPRGYETTSWIK